MSRLVLLRNKVLLYSIVAPLSEQDLYIVTTFQGFHGVDYSFQHLFMDRFFCNIHYYHAFLFVKKLSCLVLFLCVVLCLNKDKLGSTRVWCFVTVMQILWRD